MAFDVARSVLPSFRAPWTVDAVGLLLVVAVAMDLVAEWRARHGQPLLVPVWELHRLWEVDVVLGALADARIPAHAPGAHLRALFHFFRPLFPIVILVPPESADDADRVLRRLLVPDASPPPATPYRG